MKAKRMRTGLVGVGLLAIALPITTAAAQWHATAIGVAEYDTKQTGIFLAGVSASPGGIGLAPILGVQGYYLTYDAGVGGNTGVFSIKPYAGLGNTWAGGQLYGTLGYAFTNKDTPAGVIVSDRGEGVVAAGGLDVWGTGEPMGYQVLGSYNFGSSSLWTRGRVTTRVSKGAGSEQKRLGAEVAYLAGDGFHAVQPGGLLELHDAAGRILILGAGAKFYTGATPIYFKVEGVLPLFR